MCLYWLPGLRLLSRPQEQQASRSDETLDSCLTHTWQPCTHRPASLAPHKAENPSGDAFTHIYQAPGETLSVGLRPERHDGFSDDGGDWCRAGTWEVKAEEPEQNESPFKVSTLLWSWPEERRLRPIRLHETLTTLIQLFAGWILRPDVRLIVSFSYCLRPLQQTNHWDDAEFWNQTAEQRGWRQQALWDPWQSATLCRSMEYFDIPWQAVTSPNVAPHEFFLLKWSEFFQNLGFCFLLKIDVCWIVQQDMISYLMEQQKCKQIFTKTF